MPCETITREFTTTKGEKKLFATRQVSAGESLELHAELLNKLGVTILPLIDNKYNFGDLISLMRASESKTVSELIKRVICKAAVEGSEIKPHNYDLVFENELMLALEVFAFILEANYLSFFKRGLEINEQRRLEAVAQSATAQQENSSPKT